MESIFRLCFCSKQQPIALELRGGWSVSKVSETSEAYDASQISQLIGKLCCVVFYPAKLLANINACILVVVAVGCCGWLLLVAMAGFRCFILIRQNKIFNGVKMCAK